MSVLGFAGGEIMEIQLKGIDELIKKLGSINAMKALGPPMRKAMFRLQAGISPYPPAPANSKYVRTTTLGKRWTTDVDVRSDEITGKVGNNTEYAPQVQSAKFQKPIFKRIGWKTDRQVLDQELPAIIKDFEEAVAGEVDK